MAIRTRMLAGLVAGVLVVSGTPSPAAAANRPTPTTNPILGPVIKLITPPRRPAPPPPPPPAPPPAPAKPQAPADSGTGKRIVYCVTCQRVWLVESDNTVSRTHPVSGRPGIPRSGTYSVFSKSERARSGNGKVTMVHMVRFARGRTLAIGFHAIPRDKRGRPIQTEAELGSYRSLGCVRQSDASAAALWNFAPIGTKVVVT